MEIIKGTKENFEREVLTSSIPVLVDFNADWCGPCRMLAPVLEEMAKERNDIKIVSVNVDQEQELSKKYHVFSIPCLVMLKQGEESKRTVGFRPKEEIEKFISE